MVWMNLEEETNKKFHEIAELYPTRLYEGTNVNEDTQKLIDDWYHFREVCTDDDEKFLWYFHRLLNEKYPRYLLMLEIELKEIPELVDFKEHISRQLKQGGNIQDIVNTVVKEKFDNETSTERDITESVDMTTKEDTTTNSDITNGSTTTPTTYSEHVEMVRALPQSESYVGVAGSLPDLDWSTATSQLQSKDKGSSLFTDGSSEEETHKDGEIKEDGEVTTDDDTLSKSKGNKEQQKDGNTTTKLNLMDAEVTNTLRRNEFETELLNKIWEYLRKREAWDWFMKQLDTVFFGIYRG